jgi:hypothetical protein
MIKHDAIYDCYPQVGHILDDNAFDRDGNPVLYDEAIVLAYMESKSYIEKRKREYPSVTDYLDAIVKNDQVQLQEYIDKCNAVKLKYPKS